jgi:hypothetical protein
MGYVPALPLHGGWLVGEIPTFSTTITNKYP